jgi:hypothetical protein
VSLATGKEIGGYVRIIWQQHTKQNNVCRRAYILFGKVQTLLVY